MRAARRSGRRDWLSYLFAFTLLQLFHAVLLSLQTLFNHSRAREESLHVNRFFAFWMANVGIFWAVHPGWGEPRRWALLRTLLALSSSHVFRYAYLLDSSLALWFARGPLALGVSALLTRIVATSILRRSVEGEEAMGDLRHAVDRSNAGLNELVNIGAISAAWRQGPLVRLNSCVMLACVVAVLLHAAWMLAEVRQLLLPFGLVTASFVALWPCLLYTSPSPRD